jgi:hypothetical protein
MDSTTLEAASIITVQTSRFCPTAALPRRAGPMLGLETPRRTLERRRALEAQPARPVQPEREAPLEQGVAGQAEPEQAGILKVRAGR